MTSDDELDEVEYLGYTLGQQPVVSVLNDIVALQASPAQITPVPGTKPWIVGLAPISGDLLPVIDVPQFLGLSASASRSLAQLLVVDIEGVRCGLLVTSVMGRLTETVHSQTAAVTLFDMLQPYVRIALHTDQAEWPVFELSALVSDSRFSMGCIDHPGLV